MQTGMPIAIIRQIETIADLIEAARQETRLIGKTTDCEPQVAVFTDKNLIILYSKTHPSV